MILATASVLQRLFTFNRTIKESVVISVVLWSGVAAFSSVHCRINESNVHSAVFGSMILYIAYRVRALTKEIKDPRCRRQFNSLAWRGSGTVLSQPFPGTSRYADEHFHTVYAGTGFACWALDSLACSRLRQMRRQIGLPWGFALELHGW